MKSRVFPWVWVLILSAILFGVGGCATEQPNNNSARPWNSPQGWEYGMPLLNQQQHE